MENLPAQVADRLRALTFADRAVAWLYVDDALALIGAGGRLEAYGLGALREIGRASCRERVSTIV